MDPELRRRATRSEQRQHDAEKYGEDRHVGCEDDPCDACAPLLALCADPDCINDADGKRGKYCARHEAEYRNAYAEMVADAMHYERFDR